MDYTNWVTSPTAGAERTVILGDSGKWSLAEGKVAGGPALCDVGGTQVVLDLISNFSVVKLETVRFCNHL